MASPDAALLQEIARISGAINRAKAANQAGSGAAITDGHQGVASTSSSSYATRGPTGYNQYHQPQSMYGHHRGRGRGYPPAFHNGPFRGSHQHHHYQQQQQHLYQAPPSTRLTNRKHDKNNTWIAPPLPLKDASSEASTSSSAAATSASSSTSSSKNKSLVLNQPSSTLTTKSILKESTSPASSSSIPLTQDTNEQSQADGASHAVTNSNEDSATLASSSTTIAEPEPIHKEDEDMEEGEIDESTLPPPEPKKPPISLVKNGNEIIINGVTFVSDATGRKLVRKDSTATSEAAMDPKGKGKHTLQTSASSTPSKTSIDGQSYVRTKSGNLISTAVLKKRQELVGKKNRLSQLVGTIKTVQNARQAKLARTQKRNTLCRFFQKTGVCARANTCPYIHDSEKVAICPRFLRQNCVLTTATCPLSHVPNPHRMPHCQHYPRCKKGDACPYTHAQLAENAKICKDFVGLGWCEKGKDCTERHVWECPDFEEKGVCNKRGCKLGHVVRRKGQMSAGAAGGGETEGGNGDASELPLAMFIDTNPDPAFARAASKKRSASASVASEDASSGEEEVAANLLKKQKTVLKDAMQANEDFVTLVFSDAEDNDGTSGDDGSEVESELDDIHIDGISRKIEALKDYLDDDDDAGDAEDEDSDEDTDQESKDGKGYSERELYGDEDDEDHDDNEEDDVDEDTDADTTVKFGGDSTPPFTTIDDQVAGSGD